MRGRNLILAGVVLLLTVAVNSSADMGYWGWKHGYYRDIGSSKQFFIDDAIIEEMQGLKRALNQAKPYVGNPVIQSDQPWEKNIFPEQYGSVLYDEAESVFKMWYQVLDWSYAGRMLAYATSKDGLHWEKPILGVVEYRGSKENNFVFGPPRPPTKEELHADHLLQKAFDKGDKTMLAPAGEPFKDTIEKDPAKRYKMLYRGPPVLTHYMVNAAYSPDGINWTPYPAGINPVIPLRSDSSNNVFWDPQIDRYVAILRMFQPFGEDRLVSRPRKYKAPLMRIVGRSISKDFINWTPAEIIIAPDEIDGIKDGQLHDLEVMLYEGLYFGLLGVMHPAPEDSYRNLTEDVQFVFSRDGIKWLRVGDRKPVIPSLGYEWITVFQGPLVVGDEIWIYYNAVEAAYAPNPVPPLPDAAEIQAKSKKREPLNYQDKSAAIGLAKLRLDGFVSLEADDSEGTLITESFVF